MVRHHSSSLIQTAGLMVVGAEYSLGPVWVDFFDGSPARLIRNTVHRRRWLPKERCAAEVSLLTTESFNQIGVGKLPGLLGIVITQVDSSEVSAELSVGEKHMAPNGFLHAGTVVTLADPPAPATVASQIFRQGRRVLPPSNSNPTIWVPRGKERY